MVLVELEMVKLDANAWGKISECTLKYSFNYDYPESKNRTDFALITKKKNEDLPVAFSTVVEIDSDTAYMQHGGNFPPIKGTTYTLRAYNLMVEHLKENYKHIITRILNKNKPMLKLALNAGFIITGVQTNHFGEVFLIHELLGKKEN